MNQCTRCNYKFSFYNKFKAFFKKDRLIICENCNTNFIAIKKTNSLITFITIIMSSVISILFKYFILEDVFINFFYITFIQTSLFILLCVILSVIINPWIKY